MAQEAHLATPSSRASRSARARQPTCLAGQVRHRAAPRRQQRGGADQGGDLFARQSAPA
jgi:hypothetical protein